MINPILDQIKKYTALAQKADAELLQLQLQRDSAADAIILEQVLEA